MNKLFKLLMFICIISSVLLSGCTNKNEKPDKLAQIRQNNKLTVGVKFDTKPFGYIDKTGELKGYDIDLARQIAKFILNDENKVEFIQVTPQNRIITLNSGQIDMVIATMTITKQREDVVDFSQPYFIAGQAILVKNSTNIKTLGDLSEKKVGIILGTTAEANIKLFIPNSVIYGYKTYQDAFNALKNNQISAIISDDTILMSFALDNQNFKLLSKRLTKEPYGIAFQKNEESKTLQESVNIALTQLNNSGYLNKLKNKWLKLQQ